MRVRATCDHCGRDFLFFQLYNAPAAQADRCPHCAKHLGIINVAPFARRIDRSGEQLVECLEALADRNPKFRLKPDSITRPIHAATAALAGGEQAAPSEHQRHDKQQRARWRRLRRDPAAA